MKSIIHARAARALLLTIGAAGAADVVLAQAPPPPPPEPPVSYGVTLGVGRSDNIARTAENEIDETLASAGVNARILKDTVRTHVEVNADLSYVEYLENTYDGEVLGAADAALEFRLVPERFLWTLQDTFGTVQTDPFVPVTPDTRTNVNYFTTGPQLLLPMGSSAGLRLFGLYSKTTSEDDTLDSDQTGGGASVLYDPAAPGELSLTASAEKVDYDATDVNNDFDRKQYYVRYQAQGARTHLQADAGYTTLDPDVGRKRSSPLYRLDVRREVSSYSTLTLGAVQEFSDANQALREGAPALGSSSPDTAVTATASPFQTRQFSLGWEFSRNRTSLAAVVSRSKDDYDSTPLLNRERMVYDLRLERRLGPLLTAGLTGNLSQEDFDTAGSENDMLIVSGNLRWSFAPSLALDFILEHYDGDAAGGSFQENRGFVSLIYQGRRNP